MVTERTRLRIAVIAPSRYPIRQPYAGGLESLVAALTAGLRAAGHDVDLFAARGSAGHVEDVEFPGVDWSGHDGPVSDSGYPPGEREKETAAFARLADHLAAGGYDVIHNNSLHPIPLTMPRPAGTALVTTLHTPPFPEMQDPIAAACLFEGAGGGPADVGHFVSVSAHTASLWTLPRPADVVPNGVDVATWRPGPGGGPAVWFGRIIPDKAPHLAVAAARRAGVPWCWPAASATWTTRATCSPPRSGGAPRGRCAWSANSATVRWRAWWAAPPSAWSRPNGMSPSASSPPKPPPAARPSRRSPAEGWPRSFRRRSGAPPRPATSRDWHGCCMRPWTWIGRPCAPPPSAT